MTPHQNWSRFRHGNRDWVEAREQGPGSEDRVVSVTSDVGDVRPDPEDPKTLGVS